MNFVQNIDVLEGLKKTPSEYADIIIIDPPYNIGKNFGNSFDNLEIKEYIEWAEQWINESIRILRSSGSLYIYGMSEILAYLFPHINLNKRWLIWSYINKNSVANKFWQRSHESIILGWKNTDHRVFNLNDVREPYSDLFLKNSAGKKRTPTIGRFNPKETATVYKAHDKGALPRDVIKVPALAGMGGRAERFFYCKQCNDIFSFKAQKSHAEHETIIHPTQKPFELSKKLIKAAKPKNYTGLLVVPFAGTGSEMLAAKELGLDAIGFDLNPDYVSMANILIEKGFPKS